MAQFTTKLTNKFWKSIQIELILILVLEPSKTEMETERVVPISVKNSVGTVVGLPRDLFYTVKDVKTLKFYYILCIIRTIILGNHNNQC